MSRSSPPRKAHAHFVTGQATVACGPAGKSYRSRASQERQLSSPRPFIQTMESLQEQARLWSIRSEEHTSELQSHLNLVCRLLLDKTKSNRAAELRPPPDPAEPQGRSDGSP